MSEKRVLQEIASCGDCAESFVLNGVDTCGITGHSITGYLAGVPLPDWCPMPDKGDFEMVMENIIKINEWIKKHEGEDE